MFDEDLNLMSSEKEIAANIKVLRNYLDATKACVLAGLFDKKELTYSQLAVKRGFLQASLGVSLKGMHKPKGRGAAR